MVWGMPLPEDYGEFWPSGSFEKDSKTRESGWYDRLMAYYREQTSEEQKRLFDFKGDPRDAARSYGTFPSYKFKAEPGGVDNDELKPAFGTVQSHEVPRSFDTVKSYKTLGALIKLSGKILAVHEELKGVIERIEPSAHEFFPFEVRMPKEQLYSGQYYILRIGQYFDAFSRKYSLEGSVEDSASVPGLLHLNASRKGVAGLAFRKADFGNAHLWRERQFKEELTCFSDALIAEIERAGLRIPKLYRMIEVDSDCAQSAREAG